MTWVLLHLSFDLLTQKQNVHVYFLFFFYLTLEHFFFVYDLMVSERRSPREHFVTNFTEKLTTI